MTAPHFTIRPAVLADADQIAAARMGIGSALFKAAEIALREHGAEEIHVDASLAAVKFYKNQRFKELTTGQHRLKSGTLIDCVFMRKKLQALTPGI